MEEKIISGEKELIIFSKLCVVLMLNPNFSGTINQIAKFLAGRLAYTKGLVHGEKEIELFSKLCYVVQKNKSYSGTMNQIAKGIDRLNKNNQRKSSTTSRKLVKKLRNNGLIYKNSHENYHSKSYNIYLFDYKKMIETLKSLTLFQWNTLIEMIRCKQRLQDNTLTREKRMIYKKVYNDIRNNLLDKNVRQRMLFEVGYIEDARGNLKPIRR